MTEATKTETAADPDRGDAARRTLADALSDLSDLREDARTLPDAIERHCGELRLLLRRARQLPYRAESLRLEVDLLARSDGVDVDVPPIDLDPAGADWGYACVDRVHAVVNAARSTTAMAADARRRLRLMEVLAAAVAPEAPKGYRTQRDGSTHRQRFIRERADDIRQRAVRGWPPQELQDLIDRAHEVAARIEADEAARGGRPAPAES